MIYSTLGKTGLKVSRLGFGCMRFQMKNESEVDRSIAIPLLHRAFELGVNYYDTAVGYCHGDSQKVLGEAFQGMREKVILSTKNPHYDKTNKDAWRKNLHDSLERLRTDYIDVYNHHGLSWSAFENSLAGEDGLYKEMLEAKEQGLIRHICFSFHDNCEALMKVADTGLFESVTLQYNLLDRSLEKGIAYAAEHGMGVVVMGPVGGGRLGHPSQRAGELIGGVKSTPELALRFVLSNKNVTLALSGMSNMQMLEENVATAVKSGELKAEDFEKINQTVEERKKLMGLYCTGCNYCMPCPAGVNIPVNFDLLNLERVFGLSAYARQLYARLPGKAALCTSCGKCLDKCPQKLQVPDRLKEALGALDERAGKVVGWAELRGGSLDKNQLHLKLRYILKNFGDKAQKAHVKFLPHGEDQVWPAEFEADSLGPYGRKQKDIDLMLPYPPQGMSLDADLRYDSCELLEHISDVLAPASRVKGYKLGPSARRAGTVHVPSPMHPILFSAENAHGRSFDFALAYDDENLYVYADVEDDLSPGPDEKLYPRHPSCLRFYLDGRTPYMIGRGQYEEGVMHVTVRPLEKEGNEVKAETSNGAQVRAVCTQTPTGYRVDSAVPWSAFAKVPAPPGVIGFDMGMWCYEGERKKAIFINWTGRPNGDSRPSAFGKVVLV